MTWWSRTFDRHTGDSRPTDEAYTDLPDAATYTCATTKVISDYMLNIRNLSCAIQGVDTRVQQIFRAHATLPDVPPVLGEQLGILSSRIREAHDQYEDAKRIAADLEIKCGELAARYEIVRAASDDDATRIAGELFIAIPRHERWSREALNQLTAFAALKEEELERKAALVNELGLKHKTSMMLSIVVGLLAFFLFFVVNNKPTSPSNTSQSGTYQRPRVNITNGETCRIPACPGCANPTCSSPSHVEAVSFSTLTLPR
jgi:hypothetical protein